MKPRLSFLSYGIYTFLLLGLLFHTSSDPAILGKYSARYSVVLALVMIGFLPWRWGTRFLLTDSRVESRGGKTIVLHSSQKIVFFFLLVATATLGAEGYLRSTEREQRGARLTAYHPYLQNQLTPNDENLHVNRHGFRGEEIDRDKPEGTFRIFLLGGSTVLSGRVDYEKSHARLLEVALRGSPGEAQIQVLNAGTQWHTTQHSLIKYLFKIRDFEPDLVIVWHGINDLYRSFSPPRFARGEYRADYSHFNGPIARLLFEYSERPTPVSSVLKESLLLESVFPHSTFYSDFYEPENDIEYIAVNEFPSLTAFARNMRELARVTRNDGVPLVLATQPSLYREDLSEEDRATLIFAKTFCVNDAGQAPDLESMTAGLTLFNDTVREIAVEDGIPLLDLESMVPKTSEYFVDDVHYTEAGNALVAQLVADFLSARGLLN